MDSGEIYRLQRLASSKVQYAVRTGRLPNLKLCIVKCSDCNNRATQYDHRDYEKPLDADPICRKCNRKRGNSINGSTAIMQGKSQSPFWEGVNSEADGWAPKLYTLHVGYDLIDREIFDYFNPVITYEYDKDVIIGDRELFKIKRKYRANCDEIKTHYEHR